MTDKQQADAAALLAAIDAMPEPDRTTAKKLHDIISQNAPSLFFRTWYGMTACTDGNKIICYFRGRQKFGERYLTLGFNDSAKLDDGTLWPIVWALTDITPDTEGAIAAIIRKAAG